MYNKPSDVRGYIIIYNLYVSIGLNILAQTTEKLKLCTIRIQSTFVNIYINLILIYYKNLLLVTTYGVGNEYIKKVIP